MNQATSRDPRSWFQRYWIRLLVSLFMIALGPGWPLMLIWLWTCKPGRSLGLIGLGDPVAISADPKPLRWHIGHALNLIVCLIIIIGMVFGAMAISGYVSSGEF